MEQGRTALGDGNEWLELLTVLVEVGVQVSIGLESVRDFVWLDVDLLTFFFYHLSN